MRGQDIQQAVMFSYVSLEERIPANHPMRAMRKLVDAALRDLSPLFDRLYALAFFDQVLAQAQAGNLLSDDTSRWTMVR